MSTSCRPACFALFTAVRAFAHPTIGGDLYSKRQADVILRQRRRRGARAEEIVELGELHLSHGRRSCER
jgi:hypothetical protein